MAQEGYVYVKKCVDGELVEVTGAGGGAAEPAEVQSNAACWFGDYTAETCCDVGRGPTGDVNCWAGIYNFEFCCTGSSAARDGVPTIPQDDSCRYHDDGECDEPDYCASGTDCSDCDRCGGSGTGEP